MHKVLVVGGAGYIGSHMVKRLGQLGCAVTTLDNLSSGHRDAVLCGEFIQGDLADTALLSQLLQPSRFDAVMHFASFIQVGESVQQPAKYYENNVTNTLHLLDAMRAAGVNRFIFSSTAATFGEPQYSPIDERHPQQPINPYGRSKLMIEQVLEDYDRAYGLKSVPCATLTRRAQTPKANWASGTTPKPTSPLWCYEQPRADGPTSRCLAATNTRPTAPVSAITFTLTTCAKRTGWRFKA